jgi:hypothetical protein
MTKNEINIGWTYIAKISGNLCRVRIDGINPYGGWSGINLDTGRAVRIKSCQKLRRRWVSDDKDNEEPIPSGWCTSFIASLTALASKWGRSLGEVVRQWKEYSRNCTSYDQSPILGEFVSWYGPKEVLP